MKSKTIIEVNGKRYDAITGAVIGDAVMPLAKTSRNMDGFFRERKRPTTKEVTEVRVAATEVKVHVKPKPELKTARNINHARAHSPQHGTRIAVRTQTAAPQPVKSVGHHIAVTPNHTKHRVAQNSKTLMRTAVQRPNPSFRVQAGTVGALQHSVPSLIVAKASAGSVDSLRLARAQEVHRSKQISRHASDAVPNVFATLAPVAVQPAPTAKPADEPIEAPAPPPASKPADNIFDHALANASHFVDIHTRTKHFKKQVRRHMVSMASGTLALLVIAGFAAYQNTPGIQFKVASIRAGVSTGMPNFEAAGFAYNGARAESGKLTVGFSDKRGTFQLVQKPTNLTGQEVIDNISSTTAGGQPTYHAIHADGTTIYRFSNTDATWVSDGVWYTVNGTGALSDARVTSLVQNT